MNNTSLQPRKALNKAFLKIKPNRNQIEVFKTNLIQVLDSCNDKESEEFHKNLVSDFLKNTYYSPNYFINTKGRNDLVIHNGKDAKSNVGVVIEAKSPTNKAEMISVQNLNGKALQELVLYFLRERITHKNLEIKHLVVTNMYEWFIFDAQLFEKYFAQNKAFVKQFEEFESKQLSGIKTDFFYKDIAKPFIENIKNDLEFTYFDFRYYDKPLRNSNKEDDKSLVALFKLLSPEHLLKLSFANDSNSLDKNFYSELLHIIGLTETKEGGKKLIERNKPGNRNNGSLLENAIIQLDSLDKISRLQNPKQYGETHDERLFNVALELTITWVNRILFLKLLEAQLISYHKGDKSYSFLNNELIHDYDKLNSLFFQVLAKKPNERNERITIDYAKVPYLNSSLFEPTNLEHDTLFISNLEDQITLPLLSATVIKDSQGKKITGNKNALDYFFAFLDAYDFASEGSEDIQEDNKTLINASVLGLIFEKINGYKDGSFFTPGFITMYMCKETIRRAVVQKFNEVKNWNCQTIIDVHNKITETNEANAIVNSIKICDPAVGSGHFLVSALNELIVIKHDLGILQDQHGKKLRDYSVEIVNDELIIADDDGIPFTYNPNHKESQRIQETLFKEKQTIIENCLFGVDINPNSVKICRLRLWIELLKNAFYKFPSSGGVSEGRGGELETLPNIDINIKCGNSLISRFGLDTDLKKALQQSKWNIESYKLAVATYRNAQSKEQKREMERLIDDIKGNFRTEITQNDPEKNKLDKLVNELYHRFTGNFLFEPEESYGSNDKKLKQQSKKEQEELEKEIQKYRTKLEERKNNKIYENAFEWRFEFPEVLNDEGDFVGFDVVIGNPPYVTVKDMDSNLRAYLFSKNTEYQTATFKTDLYAFFIEKSLSIINNKGIITQITPYSWLSSSSFESLRRLIYLKNYIDSLIIFPNGVFEEANITTGIVVINSYKNKFLSLKDFRKYKISQIKDEINKNQNLEISIEVILSNEKLEIPIESNKSDFNLITKINKISSKLQDLYLIDLGMNTADDSKFIFDSDVNLKTPKKLLEGKDFSSYCINWSGNYVDYLPSEMKKKATARPGEVERFECEKLILYRFLEKNGLFRTIYDNQNFFTLGSTYIIRNIKKNYSLKYLISILNSKLVGYFYRKQFSGSKITKNELYKLPLPNILPSIQQPFIEKVDQILTLKKENPQADTSVLEREIDAMVYALYGLSEEEIKIVEQS